MKVAEFAEKYDVSNTRIRVLAREGVIEIVNGRVDENRLLDLKEEQIAIRNFNQSMYYWLEEFYNDAQIIEELRCIDGSLSPSVTREYLRNTMFYPISDSMTDLNLSDLEMKIHKCFKSLETKMRSIVPNWDVEYVLDWRMNNNEKSLAL